MQVTTTTLKTERKHFHPPSNALVLLRSHSPSLSLSSWWPLMYLFPLLVLPFPEYPIMELYNMEPLESASWSDLLHLITDDIGAPSLFVVGRLVHSGVFSSIPGLHRSNANSITPLPTTVISKMSSDIARCPLVGGKVKIIPGWEPPIENNAFESMCVVAYKVYCSPTGFSVHGISQAGILKWVAIYSPRGSFRPRDWTHVSCGSCIGRWILYHWATWEALLLEES